MSVWIFSTVYRCIRPAKNGETKNYQPIRPALAFPVILQRKGDLDVGRQDIQLRLQNGTGLNRSA